MSSTDPNVSQNLLQRVTEDVLSSVVLLSVGALCVLGPLPEGAEFEAEVLREAAEHIRTESQTIPVVFAGDVRDDERGVQ